MGVVHEEWDVWFARLKKLQPGVSGPEGWGACYGAGLDPEEAVKCYTTGIKKDFVERYWSCPRINSYYVLEFDINDIQIYQMPSAY